jgi:hypothetical protein
VRVVKGVNRARDVSRVLKVFPEKSNALGSKRRIENRLCAICGNDVKAYYNCFDGALFVFLSNFCQLV